ncbi:MAG TPA: hypothetical protein VEB20_26200 [Azospirillaceae bacterium]|nr:hypothetical protein [Azospirillaceae bacterium]
MVSIRGTGNSGLRILLQQLHGVRGDGPWPCRQRQDLYARIQEWLEREASMPRGHLFSIREVPPDLLLVAHVPASMLDPVIGPWRMERLGRWLAGRPADAA